MQMAVPTSFDGGGTGTGEQNDPTNVGQYQVLSGKKPIKLNNLDKFKSQGLTSKWDDERINPTDNVASVRRDGKIPPGQHGDPFTSLAPKLGLQLTKSNTENPSGLYPGSTSQLSTIPKSKSQRKSKYPRRIIQRRDSGQNIQVKRERCASPAKRCVTDELAGTIGNKKQKLEQGKEIFDEWYRNDGNINGQEWDLKFVPADDGCRREACLHGLGGLDRPPETSEPRNLRQMQVDKMKEALPATGNSAPIGPLDLSSKSSEKSNAMDDGEPSKALNLSLHKLLPKIPEEAVLDVQQHMTVLPLVAVGYQYGHDRMLQYDSNCKPSLASFDEYREEMESVTTNGDVGSVGEIEEDIPRPARPLSTNNMPKLDALALDDTSNSGQGAITVKQEADEMATDVPYVPQSNSSPVVVASAADLKQQFLQIIQNKGLFGFLKMCPPETQHAVCQSLKSKLCALAVQTGQIQSRQQPASGEGTSRNPACQTTSLQADVHGDVKPQTTMPDSVKPKIVELSRRATEPVQPAAGLNGMMPDLIGLGLTTSMGSIQSTDFNRAQDVVKDHLRKKNIRK